MSYSNVIPGSLLREAKPGTVGDFFGPDSRLKGYDAEPLNEAISSLVERLRKSQKDKPVNVGCTCQDCKDAQNRKADGRMIESEKTPKNFVRKVHKDDLDSLEPGTVIVRGDKGRPWWKGSSYWEKVGAQGRSNPTALVSLYDSPWFFVLAEPEKKPLKVGDTVKNRDDAQRIERGTILRDRDGDAIIRRSGMSPRFQSTYTGSTLTLSDLPYPLTVVDVKTVPSSPF